MSITDVRAPAPPVKRAHSAAPLRISTANPRFQRAVEKVHALGPRPLGEILAELVGKWGGSFENDLADRLERYGRLNPGNVRDLGGDHFPVSPIRMVRP